MTASISPIARLRLARLMLITGTRQASSDLKEFAATCFHSGVDIVQVRDPAATESALLEALRAVRKADPDLRSLVGAHDSVQLATRAGVDLLHLSERGQLQPGGRSDLLIGRSCHSPAQVDAALVDPAVSYLSVGPAIPGGLDLIRYAAAAAPPSDPAAKPWFAVGAIAADNLEQVLSAGARRIAVTRAISEAADPAQAAGALGDRLRAAWREDPAMRRVTLAALGD